MNKLRQLLSKTFVILLCLISIGVYGQKQQKTYKEVYNVSNNSILDLNTSHADIEFETWSKDEVVIEANIEIEDATAEEAAQYFENSGFDINGNSSKVTIRTKAKNSWSHASFLNDTQNFKIEIPDFPDMDRFEFAFDVKELVDMPPLPINPMSEFDHEAFEKDGEKYLKQWQKEFSKGYNKEHLKRLEEWAEKMEKRQEALEQKRSALMEKREKAHEKRAEAHAERREKIAEQRLKSMEARQKRNALISERNKHLRMSDDSTRITIMFEDSVNRFNRASIFYSSERENKNFKVKKTIKIKMPKSMKIKMDVRHGEVKLAENTENIDAVLSHSRLWATTIDGDKTNINASYSPINVQYWNYGQLKARYSENVALKEVLNLKLVASSSNVTIDNLKSTAFIKNDFGPLQINRIDENFELLDVSLQNAELVCKTPEVAFTIYMNESYSEFSCPDNIAISEIKNGGSTVHKGYYQSNAANKSIVLNSKYSEVTLE